MISTKTNARPCPEIFQSGRQLLPLIARLGRLCIICLALTPVALHVSSAGAKACVRAHNSSFNAARLLSADVAFKGHIIAAKSKGPIRTYAVERTYKGPHRDEWVVIAPFGKFWTLVEINGDLHRSSELPAADKSFIIGIRKFGESDYDKRMKVSLPELERADANHIVAGGDWSCPSPHIAEFTPGLGSQMAVATDNLRDEHAVDRD